VDVRGDISSANSGAQQNQQQQQQDSLPSNFQNANHTAVLRRYSDFLWLYERLHKERGGAIVPPLPEKQAVARFSAAFVEDRRSNLELFLRRLSVHPELSDSKCLQTFLRADDPTFHAAKSGANWDPDGSSTDYHNNANNDDVSLMSPNMPSNLNPKKKKDGIKQWFAETKTHILINSVGGDLVKSPDDDLFEEIERYIQNLDNQMKHVLQQTSALVRKGKEIANGMFEFGLAFSLLGQSEEDGLGVALGKMGNTADRLSVISAEQAEGEERDFEAPLRDYIRTIHAVKLALNKRAEKRLTYTTCLAELNQKQINCDRLRGVPGREDKSYHANLSLQRASEAADTAREEFTTVSQRLLREVDRFKREKADDMRITVMDYINLQIDYNTKMEQVWGKLVPELERIQTGDTQSGPPPAAVAASAGANANANAVAAEGTVGGQPAGDAFM